DLIDPLTTFLEKNAAMFQAVGVAIGVVSVVYIATLVPALIASIPIWWGVAAGVIAATWPFLVIGIVIGALAYLVITHFDTIKKVASGLVNFFTTLPGKIASATAGMFNGIRDAFKSA